MTGASEGFGDADLPGFADDNFLGLGEKGETRYDNVHVYCLFQSTDIHPDMFFLFLFVCLQCTNAQGSAGF